MRVVRACYRRCIGGRVVLDTHAACLRHCARPQLFLREMPVPVLSHVPIDTMLEVDSPSAAQAAAAMVRQPERDVLSFCVHLLALVAQRSRVNKMTPKNCGALPAS